MKTRFLVLLVVAALLIVGAGCAPSGGAPAAPAEKKGVTIGYAAPALYGGQLFIQQSLMDNAQAKGWGVVTTNANADP